MSRKKEPRQTHGLAVEREYPGIDGFRLLAAFFVVAIHTSPLASFSKMGDWMLTRVIARIAVPVAVWQGKNRIGRGSAGIEIRRKIDKNTERAYIEIDLNHLEHNVEVLKKAMPPKCELMAVVKTNAYGHGDYEISTHLDKIGVRAFAVATIDEGIRLRKYGIRGDILILGYTNVSRAAELKKYHLIQTLIDGRYAYDLNRQGVKVRAHLKIDTGMHRLGISSEDPLLAKRIFAMKNIEVCGIYTHLCCSDSREPEDIAFTEEQIKRFYRLTARLERDGVRIPKIHIQSSYGLLNYPEIACDYVRAGIALYGAYSRPGEDTEQKLALRPVLSLKSRIALIRKVPAGESVGYARSFTAERDSRIAVVSIGYGDGVPRSLSEGGNVLIGRNLCPIVGRICMDSLTVDITGAQDIAVGDVVTLVDGEEHTGLAAAASAEKVGSISNELLCRLGARLPVVVK